MGLLKNIGICAIGLAVLSIFMGHVTEAGLLMPRIFGQAWIWLCFVLEIHGLQSFLLASLSANHNADVSVEREPDYSANCKVERVIQVEEPFHSFERTARSVVVF